MLFSSLSDLIMKIFPIHRAPAHLAFWEMKICVWPKSWKLSYSKYVLLHHVWILTLRLFSELIFHLFMCDWAKILSKISRNFAAFCRIHCSKLAIGKMWYNMGEPPAPPSKYIALGWFAAGPLCQIKEDVLTDSDSNLKWVQPLNIQMMVVNNKRFLEDQSNVTTNGATFSRIVYWLMTTKTADGNLVLIVSAPQSLSLHIKNNSWHHSNYLLWTWLSSSESRTRISQFNSFQSIATCPLQRVLLAHFLLLSKQRTEAPLSTFARAFYPSLILH